MNPWEPSSNVTIANKWPIKSWLHILSGDTVEQNLNWLQGGSEWTTSHPIGVDIKSDFIFACMFMIQFKFMHGENVLAALNLFFIVTLHF